MLLLMLPRMLKNDSKEGKAKIAYYGEGLGELCNWEQVVMSFQRNNGSLFNSPATTAAALIYRDDNYHDEKCLGYINSILKQHKNWVPTFYPTTIHKRLELVDTLQKLGIHRYFEAEITGVLDETYRLWEQKDDEIYSDATSCAMAFRLLRMASYEVSSEELTRFRYEEDFIKFSNITQFTSEAVSVDELHKASQVVIDEKDHILDEINTWTRTYIEKGLVNMSTTLDWMSQNEVRLVLRNFNASLVRAEHRRYIEFYVVNRYTTSKSASRIFHINNRDFLLLSIHDFNLCQAVHQSDLQELQRWYEDCKLEKLGLSPIYIYSSYTPISSLFFEPEFSDARLVYTKYVLLATILGDFFHELGSQEELLNLIELVKGWDRFSTIGYGSEKVEILFLALYKTLNEFAAKAEIVQGRCVKDQLINLLIDVLKCMMKEVKWWREGITPSLEEYLSISCVTIGIKAILFTAEYLLGPKLSEDIVESAELSEICKCTAMVCTLLNDIHIYKKERGERSSNIVNVLRSQSKGTITEVEALIQVDKLLECNRRKLLRMVLQKKGSELPQVCKNLYFNTSRVAYISYSSDSPEELNNHINALFFERLNLSPIQAQQVLSFAS